MGSYSWCWWATRSGRVACRLSRPGYHVGYQSVQIERSLGESRVGCWRWGQVLCGRKAWKNPLPACWASCPPRWGTPQRVPKLSMPRCYDKLTSEMWELSWGEKQIKEYRRNLRMLNLIYSVTRVRVEWASFLSYSHVFLNVGCSLYSNVLPTLSMQKDAALFC